METIIESPELHNSSNGEIFPLLININVKQIASKEITRVGIIYGAYDFPSDYYCMDPWCKTHIRRKGSLF